MPSAQLNVENIVTRTKSLSETLPFTKQLEPYLLLNKALMWICNHREIATPTTQAEQNNLITSIYAVLELGPAQSDEMLLLFELLLLLGRKSRKDNKNLSLACSETKIQLFAQDPMFAEAEKIILFDETASYRVQARDLKSPPDRHSDLL